MCAGPIQPSTALDPVAGAQLQVILARLMAREDDDLSSGQPREVQDGGVPQIPT
jgi:hypothetical protein